jgi:CIC family chloride channel protein
MGSTKSPLVKFHRWRLNNLKPHTFIALLSIVIGIAAGLAAVIIKNSVHFIQEMLEEFLPDSIHQYFNFLLPVAGISLVVIFTKYLLKRPITHGIPNVLFSISKRNGKIKRHNMFSSIISSALTVGFGGSVGLEGPTVATGAAIGSNLSRMLKLEYKQIVLMLGCAAAAAMAAIFKAPITAIVFAVEVIMIDLTSFSLIPLLLASSSAVVTSYLFLGMNVLYPFDVEVAFSHRDLVWYILLGIVAGLVSAYFAKVYMFVGKLFDKVKGVGNKLIIGGVLLGIMIFVFPPLFGEGYNDINSCLQGKFSYLYEDSVFSIFKGNIWSVFFLFGALILFKVIATSITFGAGGVGGIFAPTLFMGVHTGMLFAIILNTTGIHVVNENNFALVGMAGLIAGVLHAPLTGMFLIAELTGGYKLFVPLMIVATFSYLTVKIFIKNSVYTYQLARRKALITHDKDKAVLSLMSVDKLLEKDFMAICPDATLRDLVKIIEVSHRNLFPVIDEDNMLVGMLKMDDVRHLIFRPEKYDSVRVKDIMYMPEFFISTDDSVQEVADKFHACGRYNLAVLDNGKYVGFISRAKVFSAYQKMLKHLSHD